MGYVPLCQQRSSWESSHMNERLLKEIDLRSKALGLTDITLAKKAGLGRDAVRDIRRRPTSKPSYSTLLGIAKALGCTVADLTGERGAKSERRAAVETIEIAELEVHAAAGMGVDGDGIVMANDEAVAVVGVHSMPTASFREAYGISSSRIRIIPVKGNSMEPRLWPGQRVMVDIEDRTPSPPGVFVIWDGLALVLKYVEVVPNSEPLTVRISSANKDFMSYERTLDEAHINGRVIGVWARM